MCLKIKKQKKILKKHLKIWKKYDTQKFSFTNQTDQKVII